MPQIFLIGDTHLSLGYPNKVDHWIKIHQEYFNEFLIPMLKKEIKPGDIIVHLGDLFDNRNIIPIDILNYAMDIIEEISKIAPLHILIGNHDCWHKSSSQINTIRPFKYIPNFYMYDEPTIIEYYGNKILMMPFIEHKNEQIKIIQENKDCDYLFCHSDLNGAKMHLSSVALKNKNKIDVEEFSTFKKVYSAHIHIIQRKKNFTFIGNIFEMDRGDMHDQKGIFVLDVTTGKERFIPNNISPKYKEVYIQKEDDIEQLDDLVGTKDYIDLFISNSLLINNRKLRRKLEMMLEIGGFASVDYIDDINITDEKGESESKTKIVDETEDGEPIQLKLEYSEVIRDYINSQTYENDKIKNGILQEFNKITEIYDDNYKFKDDD